MSSSAAIVESAETVRALLIEDNDDDRALFDRALRRCEYRSVLGVAISGEEAIRSLAAATPPHAVFIDLHLAGVTARDVISWIRARPELSRTLLVATTGDVSCACVPAGDFGVGAVLVKPIASEDIDAMLTLALASRGNLTGVSRALGAVG